MIRRAIFGNIKISVHYRLQGVNMKNILFFLVIFGLLAGIGDNAFAWEANAGGKAPAESSTANGPDETAAQYLKKFRGINSDLVAAYEELNRYNNPDMSSRGINLDEILNQEGVVRDTRKHEQTIQSKKARVEEKINSLHKEAEGLNNDLVRHYNGKVPKKVSDAWKTENDYTEYRISKYR